MPDTYSRSFFSLINRNFSLNHSKKNYFFYVFTVLFCCVFIISYRRSCFSCHRSKAWSQVPILSLFQAHLQATLTLEFAYLTFSFLPRCRFFPFNQSVPWFRKSVSLISTTVCSESKFSRSFLKRFALSQLICVC